jgi:hypothetical protein
MSQLYLRPRGRGAPYAFNVSVSTGGSNWISGAVSFLIGAWYSRSEHDFNTFVPLNWAWNYAGASLADGLVTEPALYNVAAAPGSSFAFSWSRPSGRQPDHYSIYWMPGAAFSSLGSAVKVLPASGLVNGSIPGSATSALVLNGTSRTQQLTVPVVATHASGVHIPGNRAMSFAPASLATISGVSGIANGTYSVLNATVDWTADGPVTELTLVGVGGVTPAAQSGTCTYSCGPLCPRLTPLGGYRPQTFISLEQSLELLGEGPCDTSACGEQQPLSLLSGQPWRRVGFDVAYGGLGTGDADSAVAPGREPGGLSRLNSWAREGTELELVDDEGWSSSATFASPALLRYFGTLELPSHPGTTHRWGDSYRFALRVHGVKRSDDERGWFAVSAVSTGAGGTFTIGGDETAQFAPGVAFYVAGSTGNDKPYCVAGSAYNTAANTTTVTVTNSVPSAVADGRLEVQDW